MTSVARSVFKPVRRATLAASMLAACSAWAFDPAVPTAEDLFSPASGPVVLGRFVATKTDPAVFAVEDSLRGNIPTGQYTVFETGRISLEGGLAVFALSRPDKHFPPGLAVLPVVEIDQVNRQLTIPMATAWRFRVSKDRLDDLLGFSTRFAPMVQALRHGGEFPAWVPVKR
ncbi:hypothetical protein FXN63_00940 [Pigmentiphaga aceris]|uniref:Uncharacterized protein n=1 Tax=Pigmentiphaga aceris TaxID=1940612 RepID=A0A5C0ARI5_9BURK|nr:hypothetical protein [Pigmentiphaga aceris]QEI04555.1 hypothetical protein FXN63_00940 [Pigmentiphaga aceris]